MVSRGEVWIATHKHANGTFVSDEEREIGVSLIMINSIIIIHNSCYFNYFLLVFCIGKNSII